MRFAGGDGISVWRRALAQGIAVAALAMAATPALAQTSETEGVVHPTHHWRHHRHPVRSLATAHPSNGSTHPETASQSSGAAKPGAATPAPSTATNETHATTSAKAEPPNPETPGAVTSPETKPAPPAAATPPETKPAAPAAAAPPETKPAQPAPAPAQAAAPPPKSLLDPEVAKGYVGQPVYGRKGEKLGDLSAVTTGADGKVKSATISWGGLFGYFQSSRTVDWPTTDPTLKDGKLVLGGVTGQQFRKGEQPQASR